MVTFTATDRCGVTDTAVSTVTITEEGVADVWVTDLKVPNKVNGKVGHAVTKSITVVANGDTITQDATVTLSVLNVPANVTVVVTPKSITDTVSPGNKKTRFSLVHCVLQLHRQLEWRYRDLGGVDRSCTEQRCDERHPDRDQLGDVPLTASH